MLSKSFLILSIFTISIFSFEKKSGDFILEGFNPPANYWEVEGGSCGEACLFSVAKFFKISISQKKINELANSPGRGIYSNEVLSVLKQLKIPHANLTTKVKSQKDFLKNNILEQIKMNHPIFLGVKIYPDEYPKWVCDHFILVVGFNESSKEFIYNSDTERGRVSFEKLLNKEKGFSIVHKTNSVFAISILAN